MDKYKLLTKMTLNSLERSKIIEEKDMESLFLRTKRSLVFFKEIIFFMVLLNMIRAGCMKGRLLI